MPGYAVLLKGINVGGRKKLAMAELRQLLTDLGYTGVVTLLNSGNAVVTTPEGDPEAVRGRVERAIGDRFGAPIPCLVRDADQLRAVIAHHPLREIATDGSRMLAVFVSTDLDPAVRAEHDPEALAPDTIVVGQRVIYQWCPDGVLAAPNLVAHLERRFGVVATARNWNTVGRIAAALAG